jgi:4-aminobutyrate aminotransferase-like enzyme
VPIPSTDTPSSEFGSAFARAVALAIDDLQQAGTPVSALVLDTVLSSDGLFVDPPGFLTDAVAAVRKAGGLFIADEVQPGFGRMGQGMWGFARHALVPDIVVMGKPMGNGMPIGAVVTHPDILEAFTDQTRYFNTFGGNTASCAAAAAVLDVIEGEGLIASAHAVGEHLRNGFAQLKTEHRCIGGIRGAGLYVAVELVTTDAAAAPDTALARRLVNGLRDRQVLISTCGRAGHVLKIRPPLVFSSANADQLLNAVADVLRVSARGADRCRPF